MLPWQLDIENNFKPRSFELPKKLLVGAESTNCSPRVVAALGKSSLGVVCEEIYKMMNDIQEMLKYVFQTKNDATLALQNSRSRGIEAAFANLMEPGEKIIVVGGGSWGDRIEDIAKSRNIEVVKIHSKMGGIFTHEQLEENIVKHKPVLLFISHGESSPGIMHPLEGLGDICRKHNCFLAVDAALTLGGMPFFTDRWGIDMVVSGSHKAIGAPPGMSLLTFSSKAVDRMKLIKTPHHYYNILRMCELWNCFGARTKFHRYHYTVNSHMLCALREALSEIVEEGLDNTWIKHEQIALRFWRGMEELGLKPLVEKRQHRLWTIHLFHKPLKMDWSVVKNYLSSKYKVVLGYGRGPSSNKTAQVGIMGYNARTEVVDYILSSLDDAIKFSQDNVD